MPCPGVQPYTTRVIRFVANYATYIVIFARAKITNPAMLHVRNTSFGISKPIQQEVDMNYVMHRAVGLAVALGTSSLMFALTLA